VSLGREPVEIPDFTGRARPDAENGLREAGFTVEIDEEKSASVAPGVVISQEPNEGTGFRGDTIRLVVSQGRSEQKVPNVTGERLREAEKKLTDAGFVVDVRGVVPTFGDRDDQRVLRQEPSDGRLPEGSTVVLYVF
jgi:serine/threonine-protein kinase